MTNTPASAAATEGAESPTPTITTVAGTGIAGFGGDGGPATSAQLNNPVGLGVDSAGVLYIADYRNHRVRKVTQDGVITTVAGTGVAGFGGDGGPATSAQLDLPAGVDVDSAGILYISENNNHRVRMVDQDGVITTVAGTGVAGFSGDGGPATAAQLNMMVRIALDSAEVLYIADRSNHRVRMVDQDGVITTVAGTGVAGFSGDGGPATAAQLDTPLGVAVDSAGTLYIADHNERVRQVTGVGA